MTFFFGDISRIKFFSRPPHDINMLRQRIIKEVNALRHNREFIVNAVQNMENRTTLCIERNGGHVEGQGP